MPPQHPYEQPSTRILTCCRLLLQLGASGGRPCAVAVVPICHRVRLWYRHGLHLCAEDAAGPAGAERSDFGPLLLGREVADGKAVAGWAGGGWLLEAGGWTGRLCSTLGGWGGPVAWGKGGRLQQGWPGKVVCAGCPLVSLRRVLGLGLGRVGCPGLQDSRILISRAVGGLLACSWAAGSLLLHGCVSGAVIAAPDGRYAEVLRGRRVL